MKAQIVLERPWCYLKEGGAYLYRVKIKSASMVDNYSHLKKCADQGISLWLTRYRLKFWKWVSVPQESAWVSRWEWVPAPL